MIAQRGVMALGNGCSRSFVDSCIFVSFVVCITHKIPPLLISHMSIPFLDLLKSVSTSSITREM